MQYEMKIWFSISLSRPKSEVILNIIQPFWTLDNTKNKNIVDWLRLWRPCHFLVDFCATSNKEKKSISNNLFQPVHSSFIKVNISIEKKKKKRAKKRKKGGEPKSVDTSDLFANTIMQHYLNALKYQVSSIKRMVSVFL